MSHGNKNVKKASIPFLAASQQVAFCAVFRKMRNSPLLLPRSVVPWPEFHPPLTNPYYLLSSPEKPWYKQGYRVR